MKFNDLLLKFLIWRVKHISTKNFVLIISGVIGLIAGVAAVVLKESVHVIQGALTRDFHQNLANYLYLSYPLIGIILTVLLTKYILKEKMGHGITDILYTISKKSSIVKRTKTFSRMLTSALTVGFGGSVGLEAPIVVTGSAIGSNIGRLVHLSYKQRTLLIGCGSAGAISAIFNSPIAGVIFSIEVILSEITISSFIPLLIASVAGALVSLTLLGDDVLFSFTLTEGFAASDTPFYLFLGVFTGLVSLYFTRAVGRVEGLIKNVKGDFNRALVGGVSLGFLIFILPPLYGEGYDTIKNLLQGNAQNLLNNSLFFSEIDSFFFMVLFVAAIILIKPVATALTLGSGGSGGIFAPSLFIGGVTGYLFAYLINLTGIAEPISTSNFTLVGMSGVMSGVLHAPLTAIFLIAEITSGYTLFVPLMIVSAISYSTISYFEKYSLYTKPLIEKGDLIYHDKDRQVLSLIDLKKIVETDLLTIDPNASLGSLVDLVRFSKRNIFPVVNEQQELMGIVTLDDIREIMFDTDSRKNIIVNTLMHSPPTYVSSKESMQSVMIKFEKTGAWNLPVIDEGKYIGFVSKSRIFNAYRKKLIRQQID
ncbi:chloride channel protein [Marivirga lumbricoides]|uniref:Chloride channel protein n=1 Tax=Marivirga lumbricoides TaxID=1046115 RepID=A0ABQ1MD77_9BACT|nr:chloride channel protein [Marivirga lumbricoides]